VFDALVMNMCVSDLKYTLIAASRDAFALSHNYRNLKHGIQKINLD
jgi:hypothetical protein